MTDAHVFSAFNKRLPGSRKETLDQTSDQITIRTQKCTDAHLI